MSTQRIPTSCIVAVKTACACRGGAKSVHTCRRIYPFFSFCSTSKLFICFYSTTPTPSSQGFMRMKWAQLLSSSSFSFLSFFFFFFLLFILFHCQKKELAIISSMTFVSGCVQKKASKIASFFFFFFSQLRLNFRVLAHDCDQDERKCDQKNGTRDNSATGTEKIFRALNLSEFKRRAQQHILSYSCPFSNHPNRSA